MNALPLMEDAAAAFRGRLLAEPGGIHLPLPDIGNRPAELAWDNTLLSADSFRRAHVETFAVPGRLSVLHVCVFPHLHDPTPIFGFDMIAGPARVTGIFLDLSPVTPAPPAPGLRDVADTSLLDGFAARRDLPDWGDIFSDDVLAVRPVDLDEVRRAIALGRSALDGALQASRTCTAASEDMVAAGQTRYVAGQRRNEHTLRMLSGFIGSEAARRFIDDVLFPMEVRKEALLF